jgi:hypothetical protein
VPPPALCSCSGSSIAAEVVCNLSGCVVCYCKHMHPPRHVCDTPVVPGLQDAVEKADIAGLSSAVERLGLGASRSRDAADGGKAPQAQQAAEQIARQVSNIASTH